MAGISAPCADNLGIAGSAIDAGQRSAAGGGRTFQLALYGRRAEGQSFRFRCPPLASVSFQPWARSLVIAAVEYATMQRRPGRGPRSIAIVAFPAGGDDGRKAPGGPPAFCRLNPSC